jgi:mRNA-degrading endonuclease RelE of RelBE toxin-antitoxin system
MAKQIAWTASARADVRAIDRNTAIDLLHRLARFLATEEGDVKRLTDVDPPELRLRLGDYRVRFYDRCEIIEILAVKNRKDAYK